MPLIVPPSERTFRFGATLTAAAIGCYRMDMGVEKPSIALDESVAERAANATEHHGLGLPAWLGEAAKHALVLESGLAAVRE